MCAFNKNLFLKDGKFVLKMIDSVKLAKNGFGSDYLYTKEMDERSIAYAKIETKTLADWAKLGEENLYSILNDIEMADEDWKKYDIVKTQWVHQNGDVYVTYHQYGVYEWGYENSEAGAHDCVLDLLEENGVDYVFNK